jgi:hypothetical protein
MDRTTGSIGTCALVGNANRPLENRAQLLSGQSVKRSQAAPTCRRVGLSKATRVGGYFLGRAVRALLQRLQRFRWGFTLPPHLGQRRAFSFCTKALCGRVLIARVLLELRRLGYDVSCYACYR